MLSPIPPARFGVPFLILVCATAALFTEIHINQPIVNASAAGRMVAARRFDVEASFLPAGSTIVVNTTSDLVAGSDGFCTLREAIGAANSNTASGGSVGECAAGSGSDSDTINFSVSGTINLTAALPNISSDMTINGPGAGLLTVRRNTGGDYRIFSVTSGTVGISGITVSNGKTGDGTSGTNGTSAGNGGGISNSATLTLTDVVVSSNTTGAGGTGVNFAGNGGRGGGIYNSGTLTMIDCAVSENTAGKGGHGNIPGNGGDGGGLFTTGGTLNMTNCVVTGNTAGQGADGETFNGNGGTGGGIGSDNSTIFVSKVTITNNVAGHAGNQGGGGHGGGIGLSGSGVITISNSTVSGNRSGNAPNGGNGFGGGIGLISVWVMVADGITVSGNTSTGPGGGIMIQSSSSGRIVNSTISGNTAHRGGGLHSDSGTTVDLNNVTITANSASSSDGHGVLAPGGPFRVRNTIIAGNGASGNGDVSGTFTSQGHNLIGVNGTGGIFGNAGFTNGLNNDQVGSSANPLNARLAALGNYGGLTQTHALLPGSPALDAGDNCVTQPTHCNDNKVSQLATDQRGSGFNRWVGSSVDIGAFESRGFTIAATGGTPQSTTIGTSFASPLAATVSSSFAEPVANGVITFTAPNSGASGTFAGNVTSVGVNVNVSGVATSSAITANLIVGTYNVTAGGSGITSPASFSLTNTKAATSTGVTSSVNPSNFSANVTFTATVTAGAGVTPTGTVQFKDGATDLGLPVTCVAAPANTCTAQFPISTLSVGSHNISATYNGDGNLDSSSGSLSGGQVVNQAASTTGVSSSSNPSDFGQSVTFTASVSASISSTPTGTVQFKDGLTNLESAVNCVATPANTCTAQFSISTLGVGNHSISATYSGDANFLSSSGTLAGGQVVKAQPNLSINDVSITEGNSGTAALTFTVTLSAASSLTVNVGYATANGTATTADSDYQSKSGTLTFNPGEVSQTITVLVNGDQKTEPDETVFVVLSNPVNAAFSDSQGTGTITNDDNLFLLLDTSGPAVNQAAALESLLFTRDPFRVLSIAEWLISGSDRNTRVIVFADNLTLTSGQTVTVSLIDTNGTSHDLTAEDARSVPNTSFVEVRFRLPDSLPSGTCLVTIKALGRTSNTGTFRIVP